MKWLLGLFVLIAVGIFLKNTFFHFSHAPRVLPVVTKKSTQIPSVSSAPSTALFVPYWTLDGKVFTSRYNSLVYFGITANSNGIDISEDGYKNISQFTHDTNSGQKKILAVRLLDQTTDEKILHTTAFQQKIISESLQIAKNNNFDGILVDLEYKALAFDEVIASVSNFSKTFAAASHSAHLLYYQAIYGDTMYRLRPFDVEAIGKVSDGIFILAYDFHKADGNPGPNFPLTPLSDEQYSFTQMVNDFTAKVPLAKITVVFGMFGYDWTVNSQGQAIAQAVSLTTNQILQKFIPHCAFKDCAINQNNSGETDITYKDISNQSHVVWFEDLTSVYSKQQILKSKGINQTGYWAYSYF